MKQEGYETAAEKGANAPHTKFYNDAAIASKHMVVGSGVNHA